MFEISELSVIAAQMETSLKGKVIAQGSLGNSPHKFVWYNRSHEEFAELCQGKRIGNARLMGRWLGLDFEPGYRMIFGEMGGKIILHPKGEAIPKKYHLLLQFEDGMALTVVIGMWGALELYKQGDELSRAYIKGMATTPLDPGFSQDYFLDLVAGITAKGKRSVKSLLTQEQTIPGLGNAVAQDIMFRSGLNPRRNLQELGKLELERLYHSILSVVREIKDLGGRYDETDLFGKPGGYIRLMDSKRKECPTCGAAIQTMQYLGGACYFCPVCQS